MAIFNLDYTALWESICKWTRKAGRVATRPVLIMWYVMRDKNAPRKNKWAIFGSSKLGSAFVCTRFAS